MASNRRDPVQGLVDYVLDIKPYHTKIMQVLVEYVYFDDVRVKFSEHMEMHIDFQSAKSHGAICEDAGWAMYPWGLLDDNSDPFVVSGDPNSGYRPYQPYGTPSTVSYWDNTQDCVPRVGPWTVYVNFIEDFTFHSGDLNIEDIINTWINDDQGLADWDSTLKAKAIVEISSNTIYLNGNQTYVGLWGEPGRLLAIHGSVVNDGTYTVVSSTFDSITHRTAIVLNNGIPFTTPPQFLLDAGVVGRAVKADSLYYWPEYGYELPVIHQDPMTITADTVTGTFTASGQLLYKENDIVLVQTSGTYPTLTWGDNYSRQKIDISNVEIQVPSSSTGLDNTSRQYKATATVNGVNYPIVVVGSTAQTYADLLSVVNTQLSNEATLCLVDGSFQFIANNNDTALPVNIVDDDTGSPSSPLFNSLNVDNQPVFVAYHAPVPSQTRVMNPNWRYYFIPVSPPNAPQTVFRLTEVVDGKPRGIVNAGTGTLSLLHSDPIDPMGWGLDHWGGNLSGPRMGAKISDSWIITVDPLTDIFTLTLTGSPLPQMPVFSAGQEIYLTSWGSLPDIIYGELNQRIPLSRYQPYYFIPLTFSPTFQTFQLAYTLGGTPMDIINEGSGDQYIGIGQHINFLDVMINHGTDLLDVMYQPESLASFEEMIFQSNLMRIIAADPNTNTFTVNGNYAQQSSPGSTLYVQNSQGVSNGPDNNMWWTVAASPLSSYNPLTNITTIYVDGTVNPVDPAGYIQLPWGSIQNAPTITSFSELLEMHVSELFLADRILMAWQEDATGVTTGVPGSLGMVGSFDAGFFDVGGYGNDFGL